MERLDSCPQPALYEEATFASSPKPMLGSGEGSARDIDGVSPSKLKCINGERMGASRVRRVESGDKSGIWVMRSLHTHPTFARQPGFVEVLVRS